MDGQMNIEERIAAVGEEIIVLSATLHALNAQLRTQTEWLERLTRAVTSGEDDDPQHGNRGEAAATEDQGVGWSGVRPDAPGGSVTQVLQSVPAGTVNVHHDAAAGSSRGGQP